MRVLGGGTPTNISPYFLSLYFSHRRTERFFPISPTPIVRWSTTVTYNLYSGRRLVYGAVVSVFRIAGVWCAYQGSVSQIGVPYAHVRCTYIY